MCRRTWSCHFWRLQRPTQLSVFKLVSKKDQFFNQLATHTKSVSNSLHYEAKNGCKRVMPKSQPNKFYQQLLWFRASAFFIITNNAYLLLLMMKQHGLHVSVGAKWCMLITWYSPNFKMVSHHLICCYVVVPPVNPRKKFTIEFYHVRCLTPKKEYCYI